MARRYLPVYYDESIGDEPLVIRSSRGQGRGYRIEISCDPCQLLRHMTEHWIVNGGYDKIAAFFVEKDFIGDSSHNLTFVQFLELLKGAEEIIYSGPPVGR